MGELTLLDRSDAQFAQQAFELFAPNRGARRQLEALLADSVRHANEEGTSCWEITLRPRELVFNVGQVALLIVRPNEIDIYYRWAPAVTRFTSRVTRARSAKASVTSWSAREFLKDFDATAITYSVRFVGHMRRRLA